MKNLKNNFSGTKISEGLLEFLHQIVVAIAIIVWSLLKAIWAAVTTFGEEIKKSFSKAPVGLVVVTVIMLVSLAWLIFHRLPPVSTTNLPKYVIGKGVWIYELSACEGGDIQKIADKAHEDGLNWVAIKTTYKGRSWSKVNSRQDVDGLRIALNAYSIKLYSWGYDTGRDPVTEGKFAISTLGVCPDGFILDAEDEFVNRPEQAIVLARTIREYIDANCPKALFAYSTFGRTQKKVGFPFEEFDLYCDCAMPQFYWEWYKGCTPAAAAKKMMDDWRIAQAGWAHTPKPIIPTLASSDGRHDMPYTPPEGLKKAAYGFRGYFGVSFYSWDMATRAHWREIKDAPGDLNYQVQNNAKKW